MALPTDGTRFGAYGIILAPEGIILIEKPGKGRGLEFPGGHGKPEDDSLEECFEREAFEETGVHVDPEQMRLLEEPRELPTHIAGMLMAQIARLPKTLKKIGDEGEIVHVVKQRELANFTIFPPHRRYLDIALRILDSTKSAA